MRPSTAEPTWQQLADDLGVDHGDRFDPADVANLPPPAARWLQRALPAGAPLRRTIELEMTGRLRLGKRWLPFTARQILRVGEGFVWQPVVGGRVMRFTGADLLGPDDARMEFRLHGLIPVARASGPGTARSAAGRLAAETVAWLPAGATPALGARWTPIDDARAAVTIPTPQGPVDVEVTVGADGRLHALTLDRWNDSATPPALQPFGGELSHEVTTADGVRIAGTGTIGWGHGTAQWPDGRFFEFRVTNTLP